MRVTIPGPGLGRKARGLKTPVDEAGKSKRSVRDGGRWRGNRKCRQREPRDPHSATARALGSGFDRRRRSGEAGDVAGCLLASRLQRACGVLSNFSNGNLRDDGDGARNHLNVTVRFWHRSPTDQSHGYPECHDRKSKSRKAKLARQAKTSTVDERTTDDDEHEAWHHARSWHPSNRSRPACRDRVSSRQTGVYGMPLGRGVRHAAAGSVSLEPSSVT